MHRMLPCFYYSSPHSYQQMLGFIGVRGCPERDIPSLCVMGWGWEMSGNSSAAAAVTAAAAVVAVVAVPPKSGCFLGQIAAGGSAAREWQATRRAFKVQGS